MSEDIRYDNTVSQAHVRDSPRYDATMTIVPHTYTRSASKRKTLFISVRWHTERASSKGASLFLFFFLSLSLSLSLSLRILMCARVFRIAALSILSPLLFFQVFAPRLDGLLSECARGNQASIDGHLYSRTASPGGPLFCFLAASPPPRDQL